MRLLLFGKRRIDVRSLWGFLSERERERERKREIGRLSSIFGFARKYGLGLADKHFRHLLEGRDFVVYKDHKPLTTAMRTNSNKYTARDIRHLDYLSQFSTDIRHVKGKDNTVPDTLSWTEIHALDKDVLSQDLIAKEQKSDSTLQEVKQIPP